MPTNQQVTQQKEISEFSKRFYTKYGVKLYIYSPKETDSKVPLDVLHDSTLCALHENQPGFRYIKSLKEKVRFRDYLVYVQVFSYLANKEGYTKTRVGRYLERNHATIINSCKQVENGFFTNDKVVTNAYNNIIKQLEKDVGPISENAESKSNTEPVLDPIWNEAKDFITRSS